MPTVVPDPKHKPKQTSWQAKGAAAQATGGIVRRVAGLPPVRQQDRTAMLEAVSRVRLLDDEAGPQT